MSFFETIQIIASKSKLGDPNSIGIPTASANEGNLTNIVNLVGLIAGIISVIVIIIAGINYALSSGNPEKTAKALRTIIYAVVSLIIISSAAMITNFIIARM